MRKDPYNAILLLACGHSRPGHDGADRKRCRECQTMQAVTEVVETIAVEPEPEPEPIDWERVDRAARWLLWEIPRLEHAELRDLRNEWVARESTRGRDVSRVAATTTVARGLKYLVHRRLIEKYRPAAWKPGVPHPFRLTPKGATELERRELVAVEHRTRADRPSGFAS